ncbi:hypothetical protein Nepgr_017952 [Nepenthes gracilis]|uniref:Uncharacterized protein n=1 Tax=Nepenthes gracilis TaxID=150966 RepID=A0AAD3XTU3_NEPGR|nr:hypothetical protein Nepgr_017952 [Nepenthes gracilis]
MVASAPPVFLHHLPFSRPSLSSSTTSPSLPFSILGLSSLRWNNASVRLLCLHASIPRKNRGTYDPELRSVFELAENSELYELERILFGPSYFSPLLKSIVNRVKFDHVMIEEDLQEREHFIESLESRFLYLAADARSTLRGWRPSYRNVLLGVRKDLNVPCSSKLPTEDLEAEIFIHLLQDYSGHWKGQSAAALKVGATELQSMIVKGGQVFTLLKFSHVLLSRMSTKVLLETANHQIKNEVIKKGIAGAASRYLGFQSLVSFLSPLLLGTFLADIVIKMMGTDYARVLQAIYLFAQIRSIRTYRLQVDEHGTSV